MKNLIVPFTIILAFVISCQYMSLNEKPKSITDFSDYNKYLKNDVLEKKNTLNESISFWNEKLEMQPNASVYQIKLAGLLSQRFKKVGDINDIHRSDALLKKSLDTYLFKKSPVYHMLSSNAISKHQFGIALDYAQKALDTKEDIVTSHQLVFDALLEMGRVDDARENLAEHPHKHTFGYLIRKVKIEDLDGDLDAAILTMEKAAEGLGAKTNKELYCWAQSNLGDMYGHAGRLDDAYQSYQKALAADEDYHYALKGIAWLAFSKDRNIKDAEQIIHYLKNNTAAPDVLLMEAELAAYQMNPDRELELYTEFRGRVSKPAYGGMYNSHLALLESEVFQNPIKASQIADEEVLLRPTAKSYDLRAWTLYQTENYEEALRVAEAHVNGKSFEPDVLYHLGCIYMANGRLEQARSFLEEAATASFELGPIMTETINNELRVLERKEKGYDV